MALRAICQFMGLAVNLERYMAWSESLQIKKLSHVLDDPLFNTTYV